MYIENSPATTPLIYGDFASDSLIFNGTVQVTNRFRDSSGDAGTSGQVLSSTGTGTNWITASGGGGGDITAVYAGTGLSGGGSSGDVTLNLSTTGVSSGSYTSANITVDSWGRILSASNGSGGSGLSGSGSSGRVAKWTGSTSLGTSSIYDDGTNISVGTSTNSYYMIYGRTSSTSSSYAGVCGANTNGFYGSLGCNLWGAFGTTSTSAGYLGFDRPFVGRVGVCGEQSSGVYAGYFNGSTYATSFSAGSKSFLIDHPDDPYNKTLRHFSVESPEVLVVYRGTVKLNESGEATVKMPDYFKSLVKEEEATVHPTPVGRPFMVGYEWSVDHLSFTVFGDAQREVSYLVYAERDDATMKYLWQPVEEEKGTGKAIEKGHLLVPEAYGEKN